MNLLTEQQIENRMPLVKELTSEAAQKVDALVFDYGHVEPGDPEREVLLTQIRQIIRDWSEKMIFMGFVPGDVWSIQCMTEPGEWSWQYPCSRLISGKSKSVPL